MYGWIALNYATGHFSVGPPTAPGGEGSASRQQAIRLTGEGMLFAQLCRGELGGELDGELGGELGGYLVKLYSSTSRVRDVYTEEEFVTILRGVSKIQLMCFVDCAFRNHVGDLDYKS